MIRKMLVVAAAAAMPITAIAATTVVSGAAAAKVDATHYTVDCTGIAATAKFSPALTNAGGALSLETTTIKGTASSCTVTPTVGGTPVTITGAKIGGTLTNASSDHKCAGLATPTSTTGSLSVSWKSSPKLTAGTSVSSPNLVTGGTGANGHATFALTFNPTATGPFQGTDTGGSSTTDAQTVPTLGTILASCAGKGLKSVAIQPDANPGAGIALHLG